MSMLNDDDLARLTYAHLGTDLECICWEAAAEIKQLRKSVEYLREIALSHAHAIVECVHGGDLDALELHAKASKLDLT